MRIRVKYHKGVFKPLGKIKGIKEGEELEIHIGREEWHELAMKNKSFEFLKSEPDIYSEKDILNDK